VTAPLMVIRGHRRTGYVWERVFRSVLVNIGVGAPASLKDGERRGVSAGSVDSFFPDVCAAEVGFIDLRFALSRVSWLAEFRGLLVDQT